MKRVYTFLTLCFISILTNATGFDSTRAAAIFTQDEFLFFIAKNHPLVKKAELISVQGDLNLMESRGAFDPVLYTYFNNKQFKSKNYYEILDGGLKVPTWFGIEGKVKLDNNTGDYLNPELTVPASGLLSSGISVPIGKGLFIDDRRKQLKKAKIYDDMSEIEQFLAVNDIFYQASKVYWDWVINYNHVQIYEGAVELAKKRFEGVKKSYYQGAEPAIDTLEAFIQYTNRLYSYNQSKLELSQSALMMSNFLWNENMEPLELTDSLSPPSILDEFHNYLKSEADLELFHLDSIANHPIIRRYGMKRNQLEIERRYKAEGLKPKLNLNYNFLTEPVGDKMYNFSTDNYKFGFEFGFSLFLRAQRAAYKVSKLKLQELDYQLIQKQREIMNKVASYQLEIQNLEVQEKLFTRNTVNYERLLEAEKRKFQIGESSLFLINSREIKVIDSQIKLIDIRGKYQKAVNGLKYSMGVNLTN